MIYYIGCTLLTIGLIAVLVGIVGLFRMGSFYNKLHASSLIESFAVPVCLIGLACLQENFTNSFKLILSSLLMILLNPVATHALGRAAMIIKMRNHILKDKD